MKRRRKSFKIGISLLIISLCLITSGTYVGYLSSSKRITSRVMNNLASSLHSLNDISTKEKETVIKNFTLNSNFKITASSSYLLARSQENPNYIPYVNLLNNLTNMENSISLSHDNKNKKLLLIFNSNAYNQPYINRKYLIQNTTEYHYNPDLRNSYINNGNNNYFETISLENNNLEYIYSKLIESLKNNLDENYFITTQEEINLNNKKQTINKVTLTIDNTILKEIINFIINDFENDKTIFYILKSINQETNFLNILDSKKFLSKDKKIILNIYTNKLGTENLKYELKIIDSKNKITIIYDSKNDNGQLIKNDELIFKYQINKTDYSTRIKFTSEEDKETGTLIFTTGETKKEIQLNYDDGKYNALGTYLYEKTTATKNQSTKIIHQLNLRITNTKEEIINMNAVINTSIVPEVKVEEDVSTSIFSSSITSEEREIYTKYMNEKLNKIYQ